MARASVHTTCSTSLGGSGGMVPQENFVELDAKRSLLRPFLGPKSRMFLANRISIVGTRTLCEVVIADYE